MSVSLLCLSDVRPNDSTMMGSFDLLLGKTTFLD